jgi:site-specific recombinase XerD
MGRTSAARRFLEFFTVNIRNKNTRTAYVRAASEFLRWCEAQGIAALPAVQPVHVAAYIEQLGRELAAPSVKQHLAGLRIPCGGRVIRSAKGQRRCWPRKKQPRCWKV